MTVVAGADGCRAGWICVIKNLTTGTVDAEVFPDAKTLITRLPHDAVLAIDIPIGLPDKGDRTCDREARQRLGRPRASSVFPAPIRPALHARNRTAASAITTRADGRRASQQSFALYGKIQEVDDLLVADAALRDRVHEVHPEMSFWAWNGCRPMTHSKKRHAGRAERRGLVRRDYSESIYASVYTKLRAGQFVRDVAEDDLLDAFAALWTAEPIARGDAQSLPVDPPVDRQGLRMAIVY